MSPARRASSALPRAWPARSRIGYSGNETSPPVSEWPPTSFWPRSPATSRSPMASPSSPRRTRWRSSPRCPWGGSGGSARSPARSLRSTAIARSPTSRRRTRRIWSPWSATVPRTSTIWLGAGTSAPSRWTLPRNPSAASTPSTQTPTMKPCYAAPCWPRRKRSLASCARRRWPPAPSPSSYATPISPPSRARYRSISPRKTRWPFTNMSSASWETRRPEGARSVSLA